MSSSVENAADEVLARIDSAAPEGAASLVRFVNEFAVTPRLRHAALILKLNHGRAQTEPQKIELERRMRELVDEVLEERADSAFAERAETARRQRERVQAHFEHVETPRDVVFACSELTKSYARSDFTLGPIDLELRLGEITAVVGQNAQGKSTLLRIIAGDLRHDAGSLSYPSLQSEGSSRIDWVEVKAKLAYLPQELPRWHGSLIDNLIYEAAIHGVRGTDNEREVRYIIERLDLAEHADKNWQELSGGYRLRFSLARALVWKPKLLVMDEPLANLDVKAQTELLQDVRDLGASLSHPMAVVLSSQHLHELEAVSENIVFLRKGEVVYTGAVADVGSERAYNAYELGTGLGLSELKRALDGPEWQDVSHDGVNYVIKANRDIGYQTLLQTLLAKNVDVKYFRDISRSTRLLFE